MGNNSSADKAYNFIEREWISINYPTLLEAIDCDDKNLIKSEILKLKNEFPNSGVYDLMSAIHLLKAIRNKQIRVYEIESEESFLGVLNKNSTILDCKLNNKQIFAIIDTGSDQSFISVDIAKLYCVLHLTDFSKKWTKNTVGLGKRKFIGRIHSIDINFNTDERFEIMFPIMVINKFDLPFLILGLDFLNWFKCSIDYQLKTIHITKIGISLQFISNQCVHCLTKSIRKK
jgi:hypothetical protein